MQSGSTCRRRASGSIRSICPQSRKGSSLVSPIRALTPSATTCGTEPLQPGQDFLGEIRQLCQVVDEVDRQAVETHRPKAVELLGDGVRIADGAIGPAG